MTREAGRTDAANTTYLPAVQTNSPAPSSGPIHLGAYVKPQDVPRYCDLLRQHGAHNTWMAVPWGYVEPERGRLQWAELDQVVQAARDCGLEMAFHVYARSEWAAPTPTPRGQRTPPSTFPNDLNDYYNFMFALADHFRGQVARYFVEEEAHASNVYFAGTPEQYMQMLRTAHQAIQAADPAAIVEDSGLSSAAVGGLYGYSLYQAGKADEAARFLTDWYAHYQPKNIKGETLVFIPDDLPGFFAQEEFTRLLRWTDLLWTEYADDYDVQQLHYFGPWQPMPEILAWFHAQMRARGRDKPIESWEFGYGWDGAPGNGYDVNLHAQELPKLFVTAAGEGMGGLMQWQFTSYADALGHPGLLDANDAPRPAATSFRVTSEKLDGVRGGRRLQLGPGVWTYQLDRPAGALYVLWSEAPTTVALPLASLFVNITDVTGITRQANAGQLAVGPSPIFVELP